MRGGCDITSYASSLVSSCSDTILRAIKELTQENISYTSDQGKTYDFNTADKLNTLLINALVSTGELKEIEEYDVDFDHQFLETEKYDAKPTYKKFLGYRPGVYVIGDKIVLSSNFTFVNPSAKIVNNFQPTKFFGENFHFLCIFVEIYH